MARRACNGGNVPYESGEKIDTIGFGIVTIYMVGTAASATGTVTVGDTSGSLSACPASDLINPDTGEPIELSGGDGDRLVASYIGPCRYVEVTFANATGLVIVEEAAKTTPDPIE